MPVATQPQAATMSVVLREATGADLNRVNVLQAKIMPADTPADTSTGWWWIGRDVVSHEDAAFCGMVQSKQFGDAAYLIRAGVRWSWTGKGLQRRLIRVRERRARGLGINWLVTDTHPDNCASSNNLMACGFRLYKPRRPWADDSLYWRKRISPERPA